MTTVSNTAATAAASTAATGSTNTLTQLASNFTDFLSLLTTQLKNQDPSSPMDTNQFTSQLVQFTSVQEQINTNATLSQLLTATQGQQLSQASSLVGKTAEFTATTVPLQSGKAQLDFTSGSAQQVQVTITDAHKATVRSDLVNAASGSNTYKWDGTDSAGNTVADGSYTATVNAVSASGTGSALPFTVLGTITGAEQVNGAVQLMFGSQTATYNNIVAFGDAAS